MKNLNFGLIGSCGTWAQNLINTLDSLNFNLVATCDIYDRPIKDIPHFTNLDSFIAANSLDTVLVATSPESHAEIIKKCLEKGINTWSEKPLTLCSSDAYELDKLATENKVILHVDNSWIYDKHLMFIKQLLQYDRFGKVINAKMRWGNWGKFQQSNVFFDLLSHLVANSFHLFGVPSYVNGTGTLQDIELPFGRKEKVYVDGAAVLDYNDFKVNCEASWISDRKIRHLEIITDEGTILTNFDGKVIFLKRGGDSWSFVPTHLGTPLEVEMIHFMQCIKQKKNSLSSGFVGAKIVEVLEKVVKSADNSGIEEKI